jgi:hypothetical protein
VNQTRYSTAQYDVIQGLAVDTEDDNAWFVGSTSGDLFGAANGQADIMSFYVGCEEGWLSADICGENPASNVLSSMHIGTTQRDLGQAISLDDEDVYLSGITSGDLYGTNAGESDMFAAKFEDGSSSPAWEWQVGTSMKEFADGGSCLTTDNNLVVVGRSQGSLFDTNVAPGTFDIVVAVLDGNDGSEVATYQFGSEGDDYAEDVYCDDSGNAYIVGFTSGPLFANVSVIGNGTNDYIALKMDLTDGSITWGVQGTSGEHDYLYGVTMSQDKTQLITVGLSDGDLFATAIGGTDFVAISFDPTDGTIQWGTQWGTTETDMLVRADIDPASGNVMTTGWSAGSDYGTNAGGEDVVVIKLDVTDGSVIWGAQYGSSALDNAIAIKCDSFGNAWVGGYTEGSMFGTYKGATDGFIMKVSVDDGSLILSDQKSYSTAQYDVIQGLAVDTEDDNAWFVGSTSGDLFGSSKGQADIMSFYVGCEYGWLSADTCASYKKDDDKDEDDDDDSTAIVIVATAISLVGVGLIGFGGYYYYTKSKASKDADEATPYATLNG